MYEIRGLENPKLHLWYFPDPKSKTRTHKLALTFTILKLQNLNVISDIFVTRRLHHYESSFASGLLCSWPHTTHLYKSKNKKAKLLYSRKKKRPGKKNLSQGRRRHTSHWCCKIFMTFFAFSGTLCLFGWKKNNHIDNELIPGVGHFHQDVPNTKFKSKQFTGRR